MTERKLSKMMDRLNLEDDFVEVRGGALIGGALAGGAKRPRGGALVGGARAGGAMAGGCQMCGFCPQAEPVGAGYNRHCVALKANGRCAKYEKNKKVGEYQPPAVTTRKPKRAATAKQRQAAAENPWLDYLRQYRMWAAQQGLKFNMKDAAASYRRAKRDAGM